MPFLCKFSVNFIIGTFPKNQLVLENVLNTYDNGVRPTSHNRTVYASPPVGGSGYEKPQSGYVRFFSATFLRLLELLRNSFIATAKTSYTTRTLCDIENQFFW
jgi:hypothetical protein